MSRASSPSDEYAPEFGTRPAEESHGPPGEALLRVENLSVDYRTERGEFPAVRGVDLRLAPGEQVALVGESGSGKTTLGMAVGGYLGKQDGATVTADVLELDGASPHRRSRSAIPHRTPGVAMIFQDAMTSLDPVWTIGSQLRRVLAAGGHHRRSEISERARACLADVGLTDTRRVMKSRPYELSGGMRQRAMLAIALSGRPRLLIADEPTSALDASLSRTAMELMRSLAADTGTALLIVSHDVRLCSEYVDRMLVMFRGEIVEEGTAAALAGGAVHPYTRGLLACVPTMRSRRLDRLPTLSDFVEPASA